MPSINYVRTFISVSPDCPARRGTPPPRPGSVAALQFTLLSRQPYRHTSDDLAVAVTAARRNIPMAEEDRLRRTLLAGPLPCLRRSDLVQRFGWGLHHDARGRVALFGREGADYERLAADPGLRQIAGHPAGPG